MMQHSEANVAPAAKEKTETPRPWGRYFVLAAVLALLLWLGLKAWQIGKAAQSLLSYQTQAETILAGGLQSIDPTEVEAMVLGIRADVLTLKAETAVFMPITPYLGWVPKVGPTLASAPELMEMADAGTETAAFAVRGLLPGLAVLQDEQTSSNEQLPQLVAILEAAKPDLNQASQSLSRVAAAHAAITNANEQPAQIQTLLALTDKWLPLAQDGLKFSLVLPQFLGIDGPKHYLIIAQNEDELRPTGGFLTGAGVLVVENGRILDLTFQDSYVVDNFQKPYGDPPAPLRDFMTLDLFVFRDANFWPDFPTSATTAMELYSYGRNLPPLDGAIAIDQQFLQLLLQGTGPVTIPSLETNINANNVIETLRSSWEIDEDQDAAQWVGQRKSFLGEFAQAIMQKVQGDFTAIDPIKLAQTSYEALQTKHLQIYVNNPDSAAVLNALNWDGRLENLAQQDYLMVVDTNMGFNKANHFVERQTNYTVHLNSENAPQAELEVIYSHTGTADEEDCYQGKTVELYQNTPTYLQIANLCYWNYLRVYTPFQSELTESTTHLVSGETLLSGQDWQNTAVQVSELSELNTFANLLLVPKASSFSTQLSYSLPTTIINQNGDEKIYQLHLQKQAGMKAEPVTVTIELPETADIVAFTPPSAKIDGNRVMFDLLFTTDNTISITFR